MWTCTRQHGLYGHTTCIVWCPFHVNVVYSHGHATIHCMFCNKAALQNPGLPIKVHASDAIQYMFAEGFGQGLGLVLGYLLLPGGARLRSLW